MTPCDLTSTYDIYASKQQQELPKSIILIVTTQHDLLNCTRKFLTGFANFPVIDKNCKVISLICIWS